MSENNEVMDPPKSEEITNSDPAAQVTDIKLRAKDLKWRKEAQQLAQDNESLQSSKEKLEAELKSKLDFSAKKEAELSKRVIEAEIKAHAVAAGIKDLDFLKMIDRSGFVFKDDGTIDGIEKAVEALKTSKPILFGSEKKFHSSKNTELPEQKEPQKLNAFDMSDEDYKKEARKMGLTA